MHLWTLIVIWVSLSGAPTQLKTFGPYPKKDCTAFADIYVSSSCSAGFTSANCPAPGTPVLALCSDKAVIGVGE